MNHSDDLATARVAANLAGEEILRLYAQFEAIANAPANISTEADRRSQELILKHLSQSFPQDAFCAEETTPTLDKVRRAGRRLWIIDPIDGTRGFARKNGEFSVMIALVEGGRPVVGVVLEPARGRVTYAVRGEGCWREDGKEIRQRCRVSAVVEWAGSTLVRSRSEKGQAPPSCLQTQLFTYSAGIKLALVARGEADVYTSDYHGFHAWDICAGHILVEEAGGNVTDARGDPIVYAEDGANEISGVIATNGPLHASALAATPRR
jgi:3'(2'), 5'-bisphosphate nucleotidase